MATYRTPGAYIEEGVTLPSASSMVNTAVPVFVGYTELHDANVNSVTSESGTYGGSGTVTEPTKIHTLKEFVDLFGGAPHKMTVEFELDTGAFKVNYGPTTFTLEAASTRKFFLYYSLQWYFANGGGPCYVSSVGLYGSAGPNKANLARAFENILGTAPMELVEEPTLVVVPDLLGIDGTGATAFNNYYGVATKVMAHCNGMKNRIFLMDVYAQPWDSSFDEWSEVSAAFKAQTGSLYLDRTVAYGPLVEASLPYRLNKDRVVFAQQGGSGAFPDGKTLAALEAEIQSNANGEKERLQNMLNWEFYDKMDFAFGEDRDWAHPVLGPATAAAAVICKTDRDRGMHKAPANVSLAAVTAPMERFPRTVLDELNDPADGKAVNVIRDISGRGMVIMGARTMDANSPANRFINTRRTMLWIEANVSAIAAGTLLLPNVRSTWLMVKSQLESFLNGLWREGILVGATSSEAYYVNVGVPESMPSGDASMGILRVDVGVSVSRPAEYIVAQFSFSI